MASRHNPRSNRRPVPRPMGRPRSNRYPGPCSSCGHTVPAGAGLLDGGQVTGYTVHHAPQHWAGSPVSGHWAGGCEQARRDAQEAAYESYRGNIAWTALCDEGEAMRLARECAAGECDITCNAHGPDADRGPAYMGPQGGRAYSTLTRAGTGCPAGSAPSGYRAGQS